jgi:hypothetical protein
MSTLLEQASLVLIPSGYKEDVVYSQIPTSGAGDLSFTRASNGTRVNSAGLVEVCPWNLVEYSEQFNNANWVAVGSTISSNVLVAPNGTTTADKLVEDTSTGTHITLQINGNRNVSSIYSFSVYAKAGERTKINLFNNGNGTGDASFDLVNGTATLIAGAFATIENVGNGWYRCNVGMQENSTVGSFNYHIRLLDASGNGSYTGNGTSGAYIWGAQINLGTIKPYFPTTDRLNVPRLTYQNGGGGCPSLLLEKQSTNYLLWSQAFTNVVWATYFGTTTDNDTISPDGTQNAAKVIMGTGNQAVLRQSISGPTNGQPYTFSLYIKQGSGVTAFLDISDTASSVNITPTSEWVRYTYTANWNTSVNFVDIELRGTSGSAFCYIWGAQLEAGSYSTSLINTTSASATRVADACYKTGISSLIGQTEGVVFVDFVFNGYMESVEEMSLSVNSSNRIGMYTFDGTNTLRGYIVASGAVPFESNFIALTLGQRYKVAFAYKSADCVVYINGVNVFANSSTFSFGATIDAFKFSDIATTQPFYKPINQSALFPTRLTNAELASLTTI